MQRAFSRTFEPAPASLAGSKSAPTWIRRGACIHGDAPGQGAVRSSPCLERRGVATTLSELSRMEKTQHQGAPSMTSETFDFARLLAPGSPAPAPKWTGLARYSFVGGNNDPDQVPVEGLIEAVDAVLRREGKTLATYGLASGPQGYRPLRDFLVTKLKRDAGITCAADDIMIVSGSLQALDLVNAALLERGDTVIIEQDTYQGALNRL